ncbi:unnamed protein product [Lampetra fluviatilis]
MSLAAKGKRRAQKRQWTLLGQGHGGRRSCHCYAPAAGYLAGGWGALKRPCRHDDFGQDGVSIHAALPSCRGSAMGNLARCQPARRKYKGGGFDSQPSAGVVEGKESRTGLEETGEGFEGRGM